MKECGECFFLLYTFLCITPTHDIKERNMNICLTPNMKENLDFFSVKIGTDKTWGKE